MLDTEWPRYLAETFQKLYKELSCRKHAGKPLWWSPEYSFWNIFWRESVVNSSYGRGTVCTTQACNFFKTSYIVDAFQTFKLLFSAISQFVLKSQITWKITCLSRVTPPPFALTDPKCEMSARKEAQK